jgi:hypothetical protein
MFLDGGVRRDPRPAATAVGGNIPNRLQRSRQKQGAIREGAPCRNDS